MKHGCATKKKEKKKSLKFLEPAAFKISFFQ